MFIKDRKAEIVVSVLDTLVALTLATAPRRSPSD